VVGIRMVTGMVGRISTPRPLSAGPLLRGRPGHETGTMFGPTRVFHHREFPARALLEAKQDHVVTLCLPAKDEATTVGAIVSE
jgi:hypothetical protein